MKLALSPWPWYPFGHGLSYTTFAYSDLHVDRPAIQAGDEIQVSVKVKNSGARAGDEVVQLYTRAVAPRVPMPIKQLHGFERRLAPGEEKRVTFRLKPSLDIAHYDVASRRFVVAPGTYEIQVGASSQDVRLASPVRVQ